MKRILFPLRLSLMTPFLSVVRSNNCKKKKTRAEEDLFLGIEHAAKFRSNGDIRFLSRIKTEGRILEISKEKLIIKKKMENEKERERKNQINVVLQAAGIPHSKRRFRSLQVVRRGATVSNPLVQAQVQTPRLHPGHPAGATVQVPQL